jgi:hypothetical protein
LPLTMILTKMPKMCVIGEMENLAAWIFVPCHKSQVVGRIFHFFLRATNWLIQLC